MYCHMRRGTEFLYHLNSKICDRTTHYGENLFHLWHKYFVIFLKLSLYSDVSASHGVNHTFWLHRFWIHETKTNNNNMIVPTLSQKCRAAQSKTFRLPFIHAQNILLFKIEFAIKIINLNQIWLGIFLSMWTQNIDQFINCDICN